MSPGWMGLTQKLSSPGDSPHNPDTFSKERLQWKGSNESNTASSAVDQQLPATIFSTIVATD